MARNNRNRYTKDKVVIRKRMLNDKEVKPVLYVKAEANSGIIKGMVSPTDVPSMASVSGRGTVRSKKWLWLCGHVTTFSPLPIM